MSTQVAVTLPDEVYQRAERLAQLTSRDVADVLADTIALSLPLLSPQANVLKPVTGLSDEEILDLSTLEMEPAQDQRLSLLLDRQQAGELSDTERTELLALMQLYQEGLLRKTQGVREAVKRGLREPLGAVSSAQISNTMQAQVRAQARDRCGYCRSSQRYVLGPLEIDHIIP
jgi:hypothetical protein